MNYPFSFDHSNSGFPMRKKEPLTLPPSDPLGADDFECD